MRRSQRLGNSECRAISLISPLRTYRTKCGKSEPFLWQWDSV